MNVIDTKVGMYSKHVILTKKNQAKTLICVFVDAMALIKTSNYNVTCICTHPTKGKTSGSYCHFWYKIRIVLLHVCIPQFTQTSKTVAEQRNSINPCQKYCQHLVGRRI